MKVIEKAWAKINYFLSVGGVYHETYHAIETLMQTISLCDIVSVSAEDGEGIALEIIGNDTLPVDSSNLAYRAADIFLKHLGRVLRVTITIEKHIPVAGGLAGGSADAAAVLRGLNRCTGSPFSLRELAEMGNEFGSDIAFCVYSGLALCQGRGEKVYPLPKTQTFHYLVANSGESVSTKEAYGLLDARSAPVSAVSSASCLAALQAGNLAQLREQARNDFEDVVLSNCPATENWLLKLRECSPFAQMSGSGPTIFAVFDTKKEALALKKALPFECEYAHSVFPSDEVEK